MTNFYNVELPSLEEALEITKRFERPIGHTVMLIGCVAPMVTQAGVNLSEVIQKQHQQTLNNKGMLVVHSPFSKESAGKDINAIYPGETVIYGINTQAKLITAIRSKELIKNLNLPFGTIPTPEMYQKYVVMVVYSHDIVAVLAK